jgi:UDP-N-acetylglucosamine 2-epimerase (non-hydrolysing)
MHKPTQNQLRKHNLIRALESNKNISLKPRMDYFSFIKLVYNSEFLISDGGSNQEECYYMNKPCLLLRNKTERNEGLNENVCLSKFDKNIIDNFIKDYKRYEKDTTVIRDSPSKKIVEILINEGFTN